ncbi:hypothetical protein Acr_00g0082350 [Actinidia rufa]|uniref:Uncharacterized protein n=1 Tax=Actinidia rufa TaxID=165716 RepID=A0A7J0DUZ2_9ERIC|nr:hypothetical protein Acr_00g0082350 [Actinidia rufa]
MNRQLAIIRDKVVMEVGSNQTALDMLHQWVFVLRSPGLSMLLLASTPKSYLLLLLPVWLLLLLWVP